MENNKNTLFDASFYIGFFTLLGYVTAFAFQYSYAEYYGIPYYFIEIKLEDTFLATFLVVFVLIVIYGLFNFLESLGIIKNNSYGRFRALLIMDFIATIPLLVLDFYKAFFVIFLFLILMALRSEIILPLTYGKDKKTWNEKREAAENKMQENTQEQEKNRGKEKILSKFLIKIKIFPREFVGIVLLFILISGTAGLYLAKFSKKYYVLNTTPNTVLVAKYGDTLFTVSFDENTLIFNPELNMLDKNYILENTIRMTYKKIGQLKQPDILKETKIR